MTLNKRQLADWLTENELTLSNRAIWRQGANSPIALLDRSGVVVPAFETHMYDRDYMSGAADSFGMTETETEGGDVRWGTVGTWSPCHVGGWNFQLCPPIASGTHPVLHRWAIAFAVAAGFCASMCVSIYKTAGLHWTIAPFAAMALVSYLGALLNSKQKQ